MECMKLRFSILFTIILAVLCGCRDDDDSPDLRMPLDDIIGVWDEDYVHITINGKEYICPSHRPFTLTEFQGEVSENQKEATLMLSSLALAFFYEKTPGSIGEYFMGVEVDCKSVSEDKIIFSGNTYIPMTGFDVDVEGMVTMEGVRRDLYLDIRYKQHSDILIGRTFEIDFTDGSVYPEFTSDAVNAGIVNIPEMPEIEPMSVPDFVRLAFDYINDTYYSKLGYDKARIRFNDDMSYTLWFREAATGEYVLSCENLHYCYNDEVLYLIDPEDFVRSFMPYFDFWGIFETGCMFHQYSYDYNRVFYLVYSLNYKLLGDELILTDSRHHWSWAFDFTGADGMSDPWLKILVNSGYFTPKAVFTEVK